MKTIKAIIIAFLAFWMPRQYLAAANGQYTLSQLIDAIAIVESNNSPKAYNAQENAAGLYQIRPIYLRDVNRILGWQKYKLADRFDFQLSRDMVFIYLRYYGEGKGIEAMSRIHNGGPRGYKKKSTLSYWQKTKHVLDNNE